MAERIRRSAGSAAAVIVIVICGLIAVGLGYAAIWFSWNLALGNGG